MTQDQPSRVDRIEALLTEIGEVTLPQVEVAANHDQAGLFHSIRREDLSISKRDDFWNIRDGKPTFRPRKFKFSPENSERSHFINP